MFYELGLTMGRYCIKCGTLFGCVKKEGRHVCTDCRLMANCNVRHNYTMSSVTGGICESCWKTHKVSRKAINYQKNLKIAFTYKWACQSERLFVKFFKKGHAGNDASTADIKNLAFRCHARQPALHPSELKLSSRFQLSL